jgi:hypothetical protein
VAPSKFFLEALYLLRNPPGFTRRAAENWGADRAVYDSSELLTGSYSETLKKANKFHNFINPARPSRNSRKENGGLGHSKLPIFEIETTQTAGLFHLWPKPPFSFLVFPRRISPLAV